MKYEKVFTDYTAQVELLLSRGMSGDRAQMEAALRAVSYYRLSGYWFPMRENGSDHFKAGASFDTVWNRYIFDRKLRLIVMDGIERLEVAVRLWLAHDQSRIFGPFGYAEERNALANIGSGERDEFLDKVKKSWSDSSEIFAKHFASKYGDEHKYLPIWMAAETMSLGTLLTLYKGSPTATSRYIANQFGVEPVVFASWMKMLLTVRNHCAHHSRLWNRVIGTQPKIPFGDSKWTNPVKVSGGQMFVVLTILQHCITVVAPQSQWASRLLSLFSHFPNVPKDQMGFPANWTESPFWSAAAHYASN